MRQGLLPYTIEVVSARDTLTARAGLPLVDRAPHEVGQGVQPGQQGVPPGFELGSPGRCHGPLIQRVLHLVKPHLPGFCTF